ncbi:MAG: hypothetical protein SGI88_02530, partial [Candidatus Hydrogenedentes bacterium]|nr:hypothetical protein [Candidatus Hydrogenedentota bacterium]
VEAERAVGEKAIAKHTGELSRLPEARPYLRASAAMFGMLSATMHIDEAIAIARKILVMDPLYPPEIRVRLVALLLTSRQLGVAFEELSLCDQDRAETAWAIILARHLSGDLKGASNKLREAKKKFPLVAGLILDKSAEDSMPEELSDEEYSALQCAIILGDAWRGSPKSMQWLAEKVGA